MSAGPLIPPDPTVTEAERAALVGQRPLTVWFTGLSGSGKSTVAGALARRWHDQGRLVYVLDGDVLRGGLNRDLSFAPEDRVENIRRVAEVAKLLNAAGVIVLTAFIAPYRAGREAARAIVGAERFVEVFVDAPVEACRARDPKGLYAKADQGELPNFTGVSAPYEAPESPDVRLRTAERDLSACLQELHEALDARVGLARC